MTLEEMKAEIKEKDTMDLCLRIGKFIWVQPMSDIKQSAFLSLREVQVRIANLERTNKQLLQNLIDVQQTVKEYEFRIKTIYETLAGAI